jgi:hypothetical protein
MKTIPCYDIYELALSGPADGNPFLEVTFSARFQSGGRVVDTEGFYDGGGVYRVRFMPDQPGEWTCLTHSNQAALDGRGESFTCAPARPGVHGPVRVGARGHFVYDDGTPYFQVGTTCYAWSHQGDELEEQTLASLAAAPFNKLRMCVFPKHYTYNANEPVYHAFQRGTAGEFDYNRFNPEFFQHLEQRIGQLAGLGIQADLILFHPYDRWGYANLPAGVDERYLRYLTARLAAYHNVWWAFANEWDLMTKPIADWDRYIRLVQQCDPAQHLRSIHNWRSVFDPGKLWLTHVSYQGIATSPDMAPIGDLRRLYNKPVVADEVCYEGNIPRRWGNIPPQEMVRRFWDVTAQGGTCGHGETYLHPQEILWWSKGGTLHGQSPARLAFYRQLMEQYAAGGLDPASGVFGGNFAQAGRGQDYYLVSFGMHQPGRMPVTLPEGSSYRLDLIDTWEMTVTTLGIFSGSVEVDLPSRPYLALQAVRV